MLKLPVQLLRPSHRNCPRGQGLPLGQDWPLGQSLACRPRPGLNDYISGSEELEIAIKLHTSTLSIIRRHAMDFNLLTGRGSL